MNRTSWTAPARGFAALALIAVTGCAGGWRNAPDSLAATGMPQASAPQASASEGVTFTYKGEGGSVAVAGEFNSWNTTADMLAKQADGTWLLVKKLQPGKYAYKFVVDGSNWKTDESAKESVDDGFGGKNALMVVGSGAAAAAPASSTASASATGGPAVSGDGIKFTFKGSAGTVALAGEFNAWNTTADMLTKQADGTWSIVKKLEPGKYAYKFVIDGNTWKADEAAKESVDDGLGGKNSVVVVGTGSAAAAVAAAAPAAVAAPAATGGAAPSATAAGVKFTYKGAGNSVALAGEFNAWNTSADPLAKQADGSWVIVKKLDPGKYAYKFVVDGSNWKPDDNAKESIDDGYGGKNSIVVVEGGTGASSPAAAAAQPATSGAGSGKGAAPVISADGVKFTYGGSADQVALAGDFNSWSTTSDPLVKQADGTWAIVKKIPSGSYSYKFLVNAKSWKQDEANPEAKDDGFGGKNSVVTVH